MVHGVKELAMWQSSYLSTKPLSAVKMRERLNTVMNLLQIWKCQALYSGNKIQKAGCGWIECCFSDEKDVLRFNLFSKAEPGLIYVRQIQ